MSVVIVNYNAGDFLREAINSVIAQDGLRKEIIVVDNASSDCSLAGVEALGDSSCTIEIIRQKKNNGFAFGCNIGQARARGNYLLFLNPDCRLSCGSLLKMVNYLRDTDDAGLVGPLILGPDGVEQSGCRRDIPTPFQAACVLLGIHKVLKNHPRFRHYNHVREKLPSRPIRVQAVSGACMMTSRDELDQLGSFDESYFLHFEDVDLCLRYLRARRSVYFLPEVIVHHYKGVSSRTMPVRVHWHKHISMMRFFKKNFFSYYPSVFVNLVNLIVFLHFLFTWPLVMLPSRKQGAGGWDVVVDG